MTELSTWLERNKGLWTRVYDEVIAPDFEKEWKRRTEEHEKELKTKDDNQQILLAHVNNEVIKNARLEEENARLKKLLQKHNAGTPTSTKELEGSTAEASSSIYEYRDISDKYSEFNKRYQEASQRIKYLERKNVAVMQKNKEMKENVRAWQEYCDRHLGKQKMKAEAKPANNPTNALAAIQAYETGPNLPSCPRSAAVRTPQSLVGQDRSSPAPVTPLAHIAFPPPSSCSSQVEGHNSTREHDAADAGQQHAEQEYPTLPEENVDERMRMEPSHINIAFLGRPSSDKLGSSQTTEDEIAEQTSTAVPIIASTESDDVPQFVFERSLKGKRGRRVRHRQLMNQDSSDGTPARPIRVKEELFSSPPPVEAAAHLHRKETMDLDELGPNAILTPRKRLRRTFSIHSNHTSTLCNQKSNSAPFSGPLIKAEPPAEDAHTSLGEGSGAGAAETAQTRAISEPGDSMRTSGDVLQPLDPNITPKANAGTPSKGVKREAARQQEGYDILAESGKTPPPVDEDERHRPPNLALVHYYQRIRATKNARSPAMGSHTTRNTAPAKAAAAQIPTPPPTVDRPAYTPSTRPTQRKILMSEPRPDVSAGAHTNLRPIWSMAPPSEPARKAPAPPAKKQVWLRDKPVSELSQYDFKPNPKYNQGYTHAFSETVRKRNDRLCLPGCTNISCCGSNFRTLASAAPPLSSSQEEELLQDYLGDAYDVFGLTQMSQDERNEVVLQARTRHMANEHGKHRQAYEGRRSPPGFWRVGFPSTQSQAEDRQKALKLQQDVVRERWLEAMRKNGKWMFRDE
ncbi:hypothetical protein K458DRAFT_484597 [Lentithecium fluviatile CBS 122367]|uniref:DNA endonuclease activator Ctp1 C-terminal domain-containing protein n=1 Tax=Lentithecium fluviatile CBS 122367 TaxID=1168545 RepID=A0A6G1JEP5_9PLEO|nr:hypothetical protein K458DRAFT_484597 [Lentithecium fluviatile CBS 122367]